jgi:plastocyanin
MNKKIICRIVLALFVVSIVPTAACAKANTTVALSETTGTRTAETSKSPVTSSELPTTTAAPVTSSPLPTGPATLPPPVITITPSQPTTSPPATTPVTTPSSTLPPTINVTVDSTGFNPATITVSAGTVVLWFSGEQRVPGCCTNCHVENGAVVPGKVADHWVKSDSGTLINGWLSSNGIYACYFGTAGTYTYHDNLNPALTGTIIVK